MHQPRTREPTPLLYAMNPEGLVLKAPNGTLYRVKVDNAGALTATAI